MDALEFKRIIAKRYWSQKLYYYIVSACLLGAGVFFLLLSVNQKILPGQISYIYAGLPLVIFGFFSVFYLVPNRYKIVSVSSPIAAEEKEGVVRNLDKVVKVNSVKIENGFAQLSLSRDGELYILISTDGYYFCLIPSTGSRGGFVDLGRSERLRSKIARILQNK